MKIISCRNFEVKFFNDLNEGFFFFNLKSLKRKNKSQNLFFSNEMGPIFCDFDNLNSAAKFSQVLVRRLLIRGLARIFV